MPLGALYKGEISLLFRGEWVNSPVKPRVHLVNELISQYTSAQGSPGPALRTCYYIPQSAIRNPKSLKNITPVGSGHNEYDPEKD